MAGRLLCIADLGRIQVVFTPRACDAEGVKLSTQSNLMPLTRTKFAPNSTSLRIKSLN